MIEGIESKCVGSTYRYSLRIDTLHGLWMCKGKGVRVGQEIETQNKQKW